MSKLYYINFVYTDYVIILAFWIAGLGCWSHAILRFLHTMEYDTIRIFDNHHGVVMARFLKSLPLKDDNNKGHPNINNKNNNNAAVREETKKHPSTPSALVIHPTYKEEQRRRRGKVIAPLHRALVYLACAFLFRSIMFLYKNQLHNNPLLLPTQPSLSRRPILYLHVGPKKTASTTLQTRVLANETIRAALALDNITMSGNFNDIKVQRLRDHCLVRPEKCRAGILNWFFRAMAEESNDTIKSCETYSNLPRNNMTFRVFRYLGKRSQVKVILVYRRFSAWLHSHY